MKILITGAAGFIGSHLYQKLKSEGHEVIGIDNFSHASQNPIKEEMIDLDVGYDYGIGGDVLGSLIKRSDIVYHLAAQIHVDKSISEPEETLQSNVWGTFNILEVCRKYKKKLVFASSSEVYGTSQTEKMSETHPLDAQSPYAASKVAGDRLCKSYIDTYGMDIAILRNFNTFGPYQNDGGEGKSYGAVIGIFTRAALTGNPITIYGDGEQRRDYMYITDALKGYDICSKYCGVLNVGSGLTVSINELAQKIKEITKSNSEIIHVRARPGEVQRLCADITKAKSLGFEPETNFDKHLVEYIEWYRREYEKDMVSTSV
jgi:UDP-glucose 4-epimerase